MDLAEFRADYNWREVVSYGGKDPCQQGAQPPPQAALVTDTTMDRSPFGMEDVAEVLHDWTDGSDEPTFVCVLRLNDGRFACIEAGCDYTGWDCRAGGSACVARTYDDIIRFGCTDEQRARFGIKLEPPHAP